MNISSYFFSVNSNFDYILIHTDFEEEYKNGRRCRADGKFECKNEEKLCNKSDENNKNKN